MEIQHLDWTVYGDLATFFIYLQWGSANLY